MAITKIRTADGEEFDIEEWLHWPLFSTVEAAAATAVNLRAFSYVVGNDVPRTAGLARRTATPSDTNQVVRGKINHDEAFIVYSTTYEITAMEGSNSVFAVPPLDVAAVAPIFRATNIRTLQRRLMMELRVGANISKPQLQGPLEEFHQGIGAVAYGSGDALTVAVGAATSLNLAYGTGGQINPHAQRRWQLPVVIEPDRVIDFRIYTPGGAVGLATLDQNWSLKVYLDGLKRRPVG